MFASLSASWALRMFAVASSTCRSADFSSAWSRSMTAFAAPGLSHSGQREPTSSFIFFREMPTDSAIGLDVCNVPPLIGNPVPSGFYISVAQSRRGTLRLYYHPGRWAERF
jgi:hypothetical protein